MGPASVAVSVDRVDAIVRVVMSGFWDAAMVSRYEEGRRQALDSLYRSGYKSAQVSMILDTHDFEVQSSTVTALLKAIAHLPQDADLKIAIIQDRKLSRMQAERIASGRYHYFTCEGDARAWIDAARKGKVD